MTGERFDLRKLQEYYGRILIGNLSERCKGGAGI